MSIARLQRVKFLNFESGRDNMSVGVTFAADENVTVFEFGNNAEIQVACNCHSQTQTL
jgi:hypothetical protein